MKVILLKDVYKLGTAGDVKKVAAGYGRNYLIPQGLAALATEGMLQQAERIRARAAEERARLNQELGAVSERLEGLKLTFPVKAGETGKLYGSITTSMLADTIEAESGMMVKRSQIDTQPIKALGVHTVPIRLTLDLVPEIVVVVYREGEPPESAYEMEEIAVEEVESTGAFVDLVAELDAQEAEADAEQAEVEAIMPETDLTEDTDEVEPEA